MLSCKKKGSRDHYQTIFRAGHCAKMKIYTRRKQCVPSGMLFRKLLTTSHAKYEKYRAMYDSQTTPAGRARIIEILTALGNVIDAAKCGLDE